MSRNAPLYSKEDLKVLNMFKEEYRRLVDSKQRDAMLRTKIFPSMFNHWKEKPDCFPEEEKELRLKVRIHSQMQSQFINANNRSLRDGLSTTGGHIERPACVEGG